METITFFEYDFKSFDVLGLERSHSIFQNLDQFNKSQAIEYIRIEHNGLRAMQYVGVISLGDMSVQILPKLDNDPEKPALSATRNLLHLLSYVYGIEPPPNHLANLQNQPSDWLEILTRLFATQLQQDIQQGMEHVYVQHEDLMPVLKGKWQMTQQLIRHPHIRHQFDVSYDEFSPNTALNQLFRFVVQLLMHSTNDRTNQQLLRDLDRCFDAVTVHRAKDIPQLRERIRFTRLNDRFRTTYNFAVMLLDHLIPISTSGKSRSFAFMLDMNRLFEGFVAQFLIKHHQQIFGKLWSNQIAVETQKVLYLAEKRPIQKKAFQLRADLIFSSNHVTMIIGDTKYKLTSALKPNHGIKREDIYQMVAYMIGYQCDQVLLIYPQSEVEPFHIQFDIPMPSQTGTVTAASINLRQPLDNPNELIRRFSDILNPLLREKL
jgi:5-methylcytosine-specific restriction enzyme subunit McrC